MVSLLCKSCHARMQAVADVPDVGTGRGMRFFECEICQRSEAVAIDWNTRDELELSSSPLSHCA